MTPRERAAFRHFFDIIAVGGALGQWSVVCWLLAPLAVRPSLVQHAVAVSLLAVGIRLAARRFSYDRPQSALIRGAQDLVLGCAFAGLACAVVLVLTAAGWSTLRLLGGWRAEAGLAISGAGDPFFGVPFRVLGSLSVLATALAVAYGYAHGHRELVVTPLTLPVTGLPPALAGFRIVHVSDLHLGPIADRVALRQALTRATALEPDLICLTGDIVDSHAANLESWIPEMDALRAPHGVLTILGNHDRHVGADRVAEALARWTGCRVLRDEVATITVAGARLHIAGIEDRPPDKAAAMLPALLAGVPPGEPVILLAHHPNLFPAAAATGGIALMLAGHTHGGQVAVPLVRRLNPARLFITRYDAGTHERDGTVLHVNRGLGTSGQRVRVGAPREITVITLVPAAVKAA